MQLHVSPKIVVEYQRVGRILQEKYPTVKACEVIDTIIVSSQMVKEDLTVDFQCDDPDDRMFVECALNSTCKRIVSGDKHLLKLDGIQGISVLKPREFLEFLRNLKP